MAMKLRRYLMSGLVIIFLTSSSNGLTETKSILSAKDISVQKTNENSLQLRNAIRLMIYEYCFTKQFYLPKDGLSATDLHLLWMNCLANGLLETKKQFGLDIKMIEE